MKNISLLKQVSYSLMLLFFAALSACQTTSDAQIESSSVEQASIAEVQEQTQELIDVKFSLSWALQGVDAPLLVAMAKGYFEDEGLNVTFDRGYGSADSVTKIAAGQYDIGFGDINSMIQFNVANPEQKVVAIYMLYNRLPMGIIALDDSGMEVPEDLIGKTLGAPAGSASRQFFPLFAKTVGINPDEVEWASMESNLMPVMLLQNQVQGLAGFITSQVADLVIQESIDLEDLTIFNYGDYGLALYGNGVMARADFAEENPEVLEAFLRAFNRGLKDTLQDPDGSVELMAAYDELFEVTVEQVRLKLAMELWSTSETDEIGLGAVDLDRLDLAIEQVGEGFDLPSTPPVQEVFDEQFLPDLSDRKL